MALVVVVVAIPIMSGLHFYETIQNDNSDVRYSEYTGETFEFVYDNSVLTINGEEYASTGIFLFSETTSISTAFVADFENNVAATWADGDTLTISRGSVTGTGSMASMDFSLGVAVYVDNDGDLGRYQTGAYVNSDATIYTIYNNNPALFAKGSIVDDFDIYHSGNVVDTAITDVAITDVTLDTTETADGVFLINECSLVKSDDTTLKAFYIIPIDYQAVSDGGTTGQIVDVIPVLLVISLLLAAVFAFVRRS